MIITLASGNKKKLKELDEILKHTELSCEPITSNEEIDVIEDSLTFIGNATKKAISYAKHLNKVVVADDSGLCVDVLNGMPGIYSKRYAGLSDYENNVKLLDVLKNKENRKAYFICAIALAFPDGKVFTYEAKWHGTIANEMKGHNGFGYDPVFIPDGMKDVVASLDENYKMTHSHRYQALKKFVEDKDEIINYWRHTWQK
ncbi:RdgB/HAM1 family non-canonical purine NTP pyrophosphatase [Acholeplasma hippikon]|nr:RdgB/HAM1 family non-canonical purine NTP pyrophosphatase [Acholeplasma hippikon]